MAVLGSTEQISAFFLRYQTTTSLKFEKWIEHAEKSPTSLALAQQRFLSSKENFNDNM